ncbi:hypothetical protein O181_058808 [Austropuccinia psidii MF-1]|uniref:Uncharacterized protein n=1 Tax=Austropuccinia psidii MF-1 TaxID=1389203 RepID=A0A9Q3EDR0_9BASI|nr:hypothetical protein [Austropuccinia psidii MF-1]
MSLKAQTRINTICKAWIITPHGGNQKFGILLFVHEMTSTPPPENLTPLPCLLSHMNWLLNPFLIISNPQHAYAPAPPSRYASAAAPPYPPSPTLMLPHPFHLTSSSSSCTLIPPYSSSTPLTIFTLMLFPQNMPPMPP